MHPIDHARSTAVNWGYPEQDWERFIHPHHWMDATKAGMADIRHRLLRHHREGMKIYQARHGSLLHGISMDAILERHLFEDVDRADLPVASDWVSKFSEKPIPWMDIVVPSPDEMAEVSTRRFGGSAEDWKPFHAWMLEDFGCRERYGDNRYLVFRHHAFGCFDAEEEWGYLYRNVPTRVLAEKHIYAVLRRVPSAFEMLRHVFMQKWMSPSPMKVSEVKGLIENA